MQEYHQNLARARIQLQNQQPPPVIDPSNANDDDYSLPSSPPPTYKSRASTIRPGLHITFPPTEAGDSPASRPPTYRSHAGTLRRPTLELSAATVDIDTGEQPGSAGSTLHRVNRVVEYLEGVIDSQQQGETANDLAPQATAAASASTESPGEGDRVAADTQLWWEAEWEHVDGLVQDCSISTALAVEILQSCTQPMRLSVRLQYFQCISGLGHGWIITFHPFITGDPLHSRAACTQPCNVNTHSRAHCSPGARLCEQWGHGCVNNGARVCASARLCRGSPVFMFM